MKILDVIVKLAHIAACTAIIIFCSEGIVTMDYMSDVADWWMEVEIRHSETEALKAEWELNDRK